MRGKLGLVGGIALLALVWLTRSGGERGAVSERGRPDPAPAPASTSGVELAPPISAETSEGATRHQAAAAAPPLLAQRTGEADARRSGRKPLLRGRVLHAGKPVADAQVRMRALPPPGSGRGEEPDDPGAGALVHTGS